MIIVIWYPPPAAAVRPSRRKNVLVCVPPSAGRTCSCRQIVWGSLNTSNSLSLKLWKEPKYKKVTDAANILWRGGGDDGILSAWRTLTVSCELFLSIDSRLPIFPGPAFWLRGPIH